jgi:putative endonuclease
VTPALVLQRILAALDLAPRRTYRGSSGVGQRWEDLAAKELRAAGYTIRDRNWRGKAGEIDIVAEEKGVVCFVEVKGKSGPRFGAPAEAVTFQKQRRIGRAAQEYVTRKRLRGSFRFDVVAVLARDGSVEVRILRNAFSMPQSGVLN